MAYSDRELLARLIKCEAGGEGETGMRAVATVVMNRVNIPYGEYQRVCKGSLRKVVYQKGQFDCTRAVVGGKPNHRTLESCPPEKIHYKIADWAINGGRLSENGNCLWYFNPFKPECKKTFPTSSGTFHTKIVHHCNYRPTKYYKDS